LQKAVACNRQAGRICNNLERKYDKDGDDDGQQVLCFNEDKNKGIFLPIRN
jgi:hypothetical protein